MKSAACFSVLLVLVCLAGCSTDGDDGSSPEPLYSGLTTQAVITSNNAQTLAAGALNGASVTLPVSPLASQAPAADGSGSLFPLFVAVKKSAAGDSIGTAKTTAPAASLTPALAILNESGTIAGECGGQAAYTISINDQTGTFAGTFVFTGYCEAGLTISGTAVINGLWAIPTAEFETLNMTLSGITAAGFSINGTIAADYRSYPPAVTQVHNLYNRHIATGKKFRLENYVYSMTDTGTASLINLTGKYYDPDYGFVDVATSTTLSLPDGAAFPDSGAIVCAGAGSSVILTAVDETSYLIDADRNGDGVYEYPLGPFSW
jgi:hypothetical protein